MEEAIDGGWGWVVVLAHGLSNVIGVGFQRNYSLVHRRLVEYYGHSESATAWVVGIHQMVKSCPSPLFAVLINRFSHRSMYMTTGILCMIAMVATAYSPSLFFIYFTYGILAALGRGIALLAGNALIQQYFDKKRGRANSISGSFNALGGIIMAPLVQFLLYFYGYPGTMLIIGGLMLNFTPLGALCHPVYFHQKSTKPKDIENNNADANEVESMASEDDAGIKTSESTAMTRRLTVKRNEIHDIDEYQSIYSIDKLDMEDSNPKGDPKSKEEEKGNSPRGLSKKCVEVFDLTLLCYFPFLTLTLLAIAQTVSYQTNLIFLSSLAEEKGLTKEEIGLLLMMLSCSDFPSRFLSGFVFDLHFVRRKRIHLYASLLCVSGLSFVTLSVVKHKIWCIVLWIVYQVFIGASISQSLTCLTDVVGRNRITNAFGLRRFIIGIVLFAAPPAAGLIRDITGSYDIAYRLAGGFLLFCVFLHGIASIVRAKLCRKPQVLDVS